MEVDGGPDGVESGAKDVKEKKIDSSIGTAVDVVSQSIEKMSKLGVDEIDVELGLKVALSTGQAFWFITKASGESNIKVSIKWRREKCNQPD